jgi:hypothetical protein
MLGLFSSGYAKLGKVMSVYYSFFRIRPRKFRLGEVISVYNRLIQVM